MIDDYLRQGRLRVSVDSYREYVSAYADFLARIKFAPIRMGFTDVGTDFGRLWEITGYSTFFEKIPHGSPPIDYPLSVTQYYSNQHPEERDYPVLHFILRNPQRTEVLCQIVVHILADHLPPGHGFRLYNDAFLEEQKFHRPWMSSTNRLPD